MAAFAPFETCPVLAVAVSGGGDSLALCLLADRWARSRGGRVVAVTVDHGLRPSAAAEARLVGDWLAARDIAHLVLDWQGAKPRTGIQAAARRARYALLEDWCREAGILHLLLGHTHDDQLETVLLRLSRATGIEGAAGMSAIIEKADVRLLRPCLGIGRDRLRAVLAAAGQQWVEDPSNSDRRFARVRARFALEGLGERERAALSRSIEGCGRARLLLEAATVAALAGGCRIHGAGYAVFDATAWQGLPVRLAGAVLNRLCTTVGGCAAPPRDTALRQALGVLVGGRYPASATLAGCRLILDRSGLLVCREVRHLPAPLVLHPGLQAFWDGRFRIAVAKDASLLQPLRLDYLGRAGWSEVVARVPALRRAVPTAVRPVLPALWDDHGVLRVPHLAYNRSFDGDGSAGKAPSRWLGDLVFAPPLSLSGNGFRLAPGPERTM